MPFEYIVNFGLPNKNVIEYHSDSLQLTTNFAVVKQTENICVLWSPKSGLRFLVNAENGEIVGLETTIKKLDALPNNKIDLSEYTDGCVVAEWDKGKLSEGLIYIIEFDGSPSYDSDGKIVIIGSFSKGCIYVKICENAFLAIDSEYKLCGVAIKL